MQPDYSRQISLKEIGADGQARLARSRVLVVGAGGLGSPVLQYLAGAGVGCLGIVDDDVLDRSNLHRQPLYALDDAGGRKCELARTALARINPTVRIETHALRFDAGNALDLVGRYDAVIDCSDNFRCKFLLSDAAVLARKPAVFASVYQFEGQLQVYKPEAGHACLRCLWPEATADGIVGNCAEAGVLGPVPAALGAMQALLALKILLDIPGQLASELLLIDFMDFSTLKLRAPRRSACPAPGCSLVLPPAPEVPELAIHMRSLAEAAARGLQVIDIRSDAEVAALPTSARHIAMPALLANPGLLSPQFSYLLICASGTRSLSAARALHARGLSVRSLAGGLQALGESG
ncbi:MAG TPA: ThiF family adenylyltransferase [Steroidobacteraceae bacterium]|nr:ThiF family adenylyltransferase [Steroidobacteraceae bacterium]